MGADRVTAGPNVFIVGAMRAGTTALAEALASHPDVLVSSPKEPNYFATLHGALNFVGPGDEWFAAQNVADWSAYCALFASDAPVRIDASAAYLALPQTAASIAQRVPDARIVVLLREPLRRARSAHGYVRTRGREDVADFAAAAALEDQRRAAGFGPIWWFRSASEYAPGLAEYFSAFGRNRVHVVISEDLDAAPEQVLAGVYDFLGLRTDPRPAAVLCRRINAGGAPRSALVTKLLYPGDRLRAVLRRLSPRQIVTLVRWARRKSVGRAEASAVGREIVEWSRSAIAETEAVLGARVEAWHRAAEPW